MQSRRAQHSPGTSKDSPVQLVILVYVVTPIFLFRNRIVYFMLHILFLVQNNDFLLFCEADKPQSSRSANPPLKRLPPLRQCRLNSWKTTSRSHCLALDHPFKLSREEFLKMEIYFRRDIFLLIPYTHTEHQHRNWGRWEELWVVWDWEVAISFPKFGIKYIHTL